MLETYAQLSQLSRCSHSRRWGREQTTEAAMAKSARSNRKRQLRSQHRLTLVKTEAFKSKVGKRFSALKCRPVPVPLWATRDQQPSCRSAHSMKLGKSWLRLAPSSDKRQ